MIARALLVPACAVALVSGCGARAPRLVAPQRLEAHCGSGQARPTSIESVVSSTSDEIVDDRVAEREIRDEIQRAGGVIAYWPGQPVALARTSVALGERDGYARVFAAAVPIVSENATMRPLYLQVRDRGARRWIQLRAYDAQNVCVEGKRDV